MMVPKRDNKHTTDTFCDCNPVRYNPADPDQTRLAEQVLILQKELEKLHTALSTLVPTVKIVKACGECPFLFLYYRDGKDGCGHPEGELLDVTDEESIPENCPLKSAPLLIMAEGK